MEVVEWVEVSEVDEELMIAYAIDARIDMVRNSVKLTKHVVRSKVSNATIFGARLHQDGCPDACFGKRKIVQMTTRR